MKDKVVGFESLAEFGSVVEEGKIAETQSGDATLEEWHICCVV